MGVRLILNKIKERWTRSERYELIKKMNDVPQGASTGTEGVGRIGKFLLRLKDEDQEAFDEIKDLIDSYVDECAKTGLILRD